MGKDPPALFLGAAAVLVLLRPRPEPYTPGAERDRGVEITRSLDRELPDEAPDIRFTDAAAEAGESYYYVRVIQADEEIAWSSPVWFGAE